MGYCLINLLMFTTQQKTQNSTSWCIPTWGIGFVARDNDRPQFYQWILWPVATRLLHPMRDLNIDSIGSNNQPGFLGVFNTWGEGISVCTKYFFLFPICAMVKAHPWFSPTSWAVSNPSWWGHIHRNIHPTISRNEGVPNISHEKSAS